MSRPTPALVPLLMLITWLFMPFQIVASGNIALPGCPKTCGDIEVPYPFGIGPSCSLPGFEVSCKMTNNGSHAPFLLNDIPILEIYLDAAQVLVNRSITSSCYSQQTSNMISNTTNSWNLSGTPYWISQLLNEFTVIGCDIIANISYGNETDIFHGECVTTGCHSQNSVVNEFCSGLGCCKSDIPLEAKWYQIISLQPRNYNSSKQHNSSQCGYAMLTNSFDISYDDISNDEQYKQQQMPLALDWTIGNELCDTAQANKSSYACISKNSLCVDRSHDAYIEIAEHTTHFTSFGSAGYVCICSNGYEGNPYLKGGCVVSCPAFSRPNKNKPGECQLYVPYVIGLIIGLGFGTGLCAFLISFAIRRRIELSEKRKQEKLKEKFFNQNQGFLCSRIKLLVLAFVSIIDEIVIYFLSFIIHNLF